MNNLPKISILMNCFNGEEYLRDALDSAIQQSYDDWELIFYNNASYDDSKKIFLSYKDDRLKYFERNTNVGIVFARNEALCHAKGEWIAILDVDDIWSKSKLEEQIKALKSINSQKPIVVFSNCEVITKDKTLKLDQENSKEKLFEKLLSFDISIPWSSVLISRDLLTEFNGFDTKFPNAHDLDFLLKSARNYNFVHLTQRLVSVRYHSNSLTSANKDEDGQYYKEILSVLEQYSDNESAIIGSTKIKVSYLMLLLRKLEVLKFFKYISSFTFSELRYFPRIFLKRFFN